MSRAPAVVIAAAAAALAAGAGIGVRATYGAQVSGDEPQYLISALSLADDGDLDVSDEIASGSFEPFHEIPLDPQTRELAGGREVSPHDPLLPALLALPLALGGWVAAKAVLALLAGALAGLTVWVALARFGARPRPAFLAGVVFGCSAPLAVYGNQVYPEVPAALCTLGALAALTGRGRFGWAAAGVLVVALPWLSIKYVPVAAVLAAGAVLRALGQGGRRAALALAAALVLAGAAYIAAHLAWYGGVTPYASGDHFVAGEFTVIGRPDLGGRATRLAGLVTDARFGLVAWQPAWLLALPALGSLARARPPGTWLLLSALAAGWLNATFVALTMHGWWWPGRQVVVVLPLAVVSVARWVSAGRGRAAALGALGFAGMLSYAWVVAEGYAGHLTWIVDFFETSDPLYRGVAAVLPDLRVDDTRTWILHVLWSVVLLALLAWGYRDARTRPAYRPGSAPDCGGPAGAV